VEPIEDGQAESSTYSITLPQWEVRTEIF